MISERSTRIRRVVAEVSLLEEEEEEEEEEEGEREVEEHPVRAGMHRYFCTARVRADACRGASR